MYSNVFFIYCRRKSDPEQHSLTSSCKKQKLSIPMSHNMATSESISANTSISKGRLLNPDHVNIDVIVSSDEIVNERYLHTWYKFYMGLPYSLLQ